MIRASPSSSSSASDEETGCRASSDGSRTGVGKGVEDEERARTASDVRGRSCRVRMACIDGRSESSAAIYALTRARTSGCVEDL